MLPNERKLKVAFFVDILVEDFDGATRTIFELVNRIQKNKFEFLFICGSGPNKKFNHEILKVPNIHLPFNSTYSIAIPKFAKRKINIKLTEFCPDIVHITSPSPLGFFGMEYAKINKIPVITIYHTHFLSYLPYYLKHANFLIPIATEYVSKLMKSFYERFDVVLVPTKPIVEDLIKHNIKTDNVRFWARGVNTQIFSPLKRNLTLIKQLTKNDLPNIIFASRLVWEKNLTTLIEVYNQAKNNGLIANFIVAGEGIASNDLKKNMPDAYFLGHQTHQNLSVYYASSDIFLFPSVTETYGNVVIEAMASGLPCVIADGGGSASFINQGENGFLCEPSNPIDYIQRIKSILNNENLRNQFITEGLSYAEALDWDTIANEYFKRLTSLASSKHLTEAR